MNFKSKTVSKTFKSVHTIPLDFTKIHMQSLHIFNNFDILSNSLYARRSLVSLQVLEPIIILKKKSDAIATTYI